ncbi:MAG: hypothetical protein A3I61_11900 [Acidobacteria bacterium RIFCSPLOWO2_02_FULL_68_18]|nr:MAG: hypothetical protein A3I61_11900 [Acidobacteria bacterium RIFCSPLOWO2_02_FULL_68_18]OFW49658.1 MAG: hypothetical protein A3G77_16465 [Acidobacteria bacterium RIFCSPLOWO2_12_FULL_68_19]
MPLYEYECDACGRRFELIRRYSDPAVDSCTVCGKGPVRRLFSSPAIQFKGSGWYVTDYARKGQAEKTSGGKSDAGGSEAGSGEKQGDGAGKGDAAGKNDGAGKGDDGPTSTPPGATGTKS